MFNTMSFICLFDDLIEIMNTGISMYSTSFHSHLSNLFAGDRFTWNGQIIWNDELRYSESCVGNLFGNCFPIKGFAYRFIWTPQGWVEWISANVLWTAQVHWQVPVFFLLENKANCVDIFFYIVKVTARNSNGYNGTEVLLDALFLMNTWSYRLLLSETWWLRRASSFLGNVDCR